jgi:hypothetical protein
MLHLAHVGGPALVALAAHGLRDFAVRSDQDPALPRGHLLVGVEGERRDVPVHSDPLAGAVDRAKRLAGVLEHPQSAIRGDLAERREIRRVSEDVDREQAGGVLPHRGSCLLWINRQRDRIDVGEDGCGALVKQAVGRCDEGQRAGDDLIALAPAQRPHAEVKRGRPARDRDRVAVTEPVGEVRLELLELRAQRE